MFLVLLKILFNLFLLLIAAFISGVKNTDDCLGLRLIDLTGACSFNTSWYNFSQAQYISSVSWNIYAVQKGTLLTSLENLT